MKKSRTGVEASKELNAAQMDPGKLLVLAEIMERDVVTEEDEKVAADARELAKQLRKKTH